MIYLLLALMLSLIIVVTFKLYPRFQINVMQAITANYVMAAILGYTSIGGIPAPSYIVNSSWFYVAVISGVSLIVVFNLFALNAKTVGIALTSVASKMSVMIPVILGTLMFGETMTWVKVVGVIMAMFSFYLIFKKKEGYNIRSSLIVLPILLFIGNGMNDSIFKYVQFFYLKTNSIYFEFLTTAFSISLLLGILFLVIKSFFVKSRIQMKNIIAGAWLGVCNWFSTLFFLKGLSQMDVSVFIPIFNAGLVSLSAIVGLLIFKEKLSKINIFGLILSIISITIIAYATN
jgi:drug/metabolite transporter (DMT)-like permease